MLTRFTVGNFLSFKENQEFSMFKGKPKIKSGHIYDSGSLKILKFAAVFGANASGKSNLVKSIAYAAGLILNGMEKNYTNEGPWFKLDPEAENKPSYFEFEILLHGQLYAYGFEIMMKHQTLASEWLVELHANGADKTLFSRNLMDYEEYKQGVSEKFSSEIGVSHNELKKKFKVYADDIRNNDSILFLHEMNRSKQDLYKTKHELTIFKEVFEWFKETLVITYPDMPVSNLTYFWDASNKEEIRNMISSFDTGISDYQEEDVELEDMMKNLPYQVQQAVKKGISRFSRGTKDADKTTPSALVVRSNYSYYIISNDSTNSNLVKTLRFKHGNHTNLFDYRDESDGTRRLFDLLEVLLTKKDSVFIIDEIDRSLHPQLTYRLIHEFLLRAEQRNVQLIITTHESRLLDFDLLRQDEVWIASKDARGATQLYSLDEYNVRFDKKVDKAYLEGRYGGVPLFTTLFPLNKEVESED